MAKDEFEKADAEAGVMVEAEAEEPSEEKTLPAVVESTTALTTPQDMMQFREQLVGIYHKGSKSLVEKLTREHRNNPETLVMALVDELVRETDTLLGNALVATHQGSLRDASVISYKRAEVLEKAIKAVQAKQVFDKDRGFDLESPFMGVVWRYFMENVKSVFMDIGMSPEVNDTFFRSLAARMKEWKKDLKNKLDDMNSLKE
jgi:hypothetical protein